MRTPGCSRLLLLSVLGAGGCLGSVDGHREIGWDYDDHRGGRAEAGSGSAAQRTFYVRASGDDANSGESPDDSWGSLARVNQQDLEPGDSVWFEAGARFSGTLNLDSDDSGSASAPVRIGSFGSAIVIANAEGIEIAGLLLVGDWDAQKQQGNDGEGVSATGNQSGRRFSYLRLRDLDISGFKRAGIGLHATPNDDAKHSGFEDVEISACSVHDNGDAGVLSDGPFTSDQGYSHAELRVREVRAYNNRGLMHKGAHTGSGIVLSDAEQVLIEDSIAHDNGEYNDYPKGGSFGIWAWDASHVTIQHNESYRNRTQSVDGGGFDLDGGVTDSIVQYNYSHDNAGAGFGAFQFGGARPFSNNVTQYNISQNDGFGLLVWDGNGDLGALALAQNVSDGAHPSFVTYSALQETVVFNNIFFSTGDTLFDVYDARGLSLQGDDYWSADQPFHGKWNSGGEQPVSFDSFEAFVDGTDQERRDGEGTGLNVEPQLKAAGTGGTLDDSGMLGTLSMYKLQPGSPLVGHGADPAWFGVELATRDFFGDPVPRAGRRDIGVHHP